MGNTRNTYMLTGTDIDWKTDTDTSDSDSGRIKANVEFPKGGLGDAANKDGVLEDMIRGHIDKNLY